MKKHERKVTRERRRRNKKIHRTRGSTVQYRWMREVDAHYHRELINRTRLSKALTIGVFYFKSSLPHCL